MTELIEILHKFEKETMNIPELDAAHEAVYQAEKLVKELEKKYKKQIDLKSESFHFRNYLKKTKLVNAKYEHVEEVNRIIKAKD